MNASSPSPQNSYLIRAGQIIDGTGAAPLRQGAILVQNGIIRFVGPQARAPKRPAVPVIDAPKLTLIPGLIDGHNSILSRGIYPSIKVLRHYLQHGITTAVTFHGNPNGGELLGGPLRDAIDQGILRGCARLFVGYVVNCTNGHNDGRRADGPWEVRRAVREMVKARADFIKTASTGGFWGNHEGVRTPNYTREELVALVEEAHSWGMVVGVHAHAEPGISLAVEAGADIIYHGCLIEPPVLAKMAERSTWYMPTLRVTSARNIVAWPHRPWIQAKLEATAKPHRAGVREAIRVGVPLAGGCDGPGSPVGWRSGEGPVFELGELVDCGLTPIEAIKTCTLQTARAYKIDQRVGSLEVGKEADIVGVHGNPAKGLVAMRDQRKIGIVLQRGRVEYADIAHQKYYSITDPVEKLGL